MTFFSFSEKQASDESISEESDIEYDDEEEFNKRDRMYRQSHQEKRFNEAAAKMKQSIGKKDYEDVFSDEDKKGEPQKNKRRKREERGSSGSAFAANKANLNKKFRKGSGARGSTSRRHSSTGENRQTPRGPKPSEVFPASNWPAGMTKQTVDMLTISQYQVNTKMKYNCVFNIAFFHFSDNEEAGTGRKETGIE